MILESFRLANSYSNTYAMGAIFAMALATFLPRFFPMVLLKPAHFPFDLPSGSILSRLPFWDFGFPRSFIKRWSDLSFP